MIEISNVTKLKVKFNKYHVVNDADNTGARPQEKLKVCRHDPNSV